MAGSLRAEKSGFALEVQKRLSEKFDCSEAAKVLRWIRLLPHPSGVPEHIMESVLKIPSDIQTVDMDTFVQFLRDGNVFGFIMASLDPNNLDIFKTKTWQISANAAFETSRQRDRIGSFLSFQSSFGVDPACQFQTDQLYEITDPTQVMISIRCLGIEAQKNSSYQGPSGYWPQKSMQNKREFTDAQLRAGENIIGLQMGSNTGATASGVSFGGRRHITDTF